RRLTLVRISAISFARGENPQPPRPHAPEHGCERAAKVYPPGVTVPYKNAAFLESNEARPLRILAEYLDPLHQFRHQRIHDTIVFFGSARLREEGPLGRYYADARELARLITMWSQSLTVSA